MRESNFSFPNQNRACVTITSALYDRRALDCTAVLPLINSLSHLIYLTSTSPRIREIMTKDGGLERLIRILKTTRIDDKRMAWIWSMAIQCVVNVGVRGTETIRCRVVDAGMVEVVIHILKHFLKALEKVKTEKDKEIYTLTGSRVSEGAYETSASAPSIDTNTSPQIEDPSQQAAAQHPDLMRRGESNNLSMVSRSLPSLRRTLGSQQLQNDMETIPNNGNSQPSSPAPATYQRQANNGAADLTLPLEHTASEGVTIPSNSISHSSDATEEVLYREEDILLSLQLLAYVSKYPHLRQRLHTEFECNLFGLVERFTSRGHTAEIQCWASIIMRNACRKDESRGGIRQCANMACGKWEKYPREFSKCRRCRKAKYCSKACQSKAWSDGHRYWCVERHSEPGTSTSTAPQPQPQELSILQQNVGPTPTPMIP
ncbi:hypothetical protein K493DRAFT_320541 [Basidiobolus meristosporus CBS 931.73]|uniref:MYND-type domain-containing protein n=1 Tax=Basidiobolus meristosporus CBS 931.73 TaxID=1314790 RepID=A0A1Y1X8D0_9FUNG|nr:hypothetical protein K493DRAFT_320541 [Basidiobolus meristosporus CBS 931.73]|eukprot:ORX81995.1 hypothetical protein K493DRAFT_320541 [Basidiobolus meristosporus CBS 931.73]